MRKQTVICLFWYVVVDQGRLNLGRQAQWRHQIGHSIAKAVWTHVAFVAARFLLPLVVGRVLTEMSTIQIGNKKKNKKNNARHFSALE